MEAMPDIAWEHNEVILRDKFLIVSKYSMEGQGMLLRSEEAFDVAVGSRGLVEEAALGIHRAVL